MYWAQIFAELKIPLMKSRIQVTANEAKSHYRPHVFYEYLECTSKRTFVKYGKW